MAEDVHERAGCGKPIAKRAVCICSNDVSHRVSVTDNVAVGVIVRHIDRTVTLQVQQSTNAARTLQCSRNVLTPIVERLVCNSANYLMLINEVPVVVEKRCDGYRRRLADAASLVVILVGDDRYAVGRDGNETVLHVIGVVENAVKGHVTVCVVCWLSPRRRGTKDRSVLVDVGGRVDVCDEVVCGIA